MDEKTVTTSDREGNEFEVPVGVDGVSPVTPNNPVANALSPEDVAKLSGDDADAPASDADEEPAEVPDEDEAPARNASKADWVNYAVDVKKADREYAESKTRDELADEFGGE